MSGKSGPSPVQRKAFMRAVADNVGKDLIQLSATYWSHVTATLLLSADSSRHRTRDESLTQSLMTALLSKHRRNNNNNDHHVNIYSAVIVARERLYYNFTITIISITSRATHVIVTTV